MLSIIQETEARTGLINGRKKILLVTHDKVIEAFASTGLDPNSPYQFKDSFYSNPTGVTPFWLGHLKGDNQFKFAFKHKN